MGSATFIFSLDCEGKWGAADRLDQTGYRHFTSDMLEAAYRRLVHLFDRYEVPATFAFVSCFFLTPDEVHAHPQWFEAVDYHGSNWFEAFQSDFRAGNYDGWLCPSTLETVLSSGAHEIASHGFSHIPLGASDISEHVFHREMESVRAAEALRGIRSDTFIFPRNRIGYLASLAGHGYRAYRPPLPRESKRGPVAKVSQYLNEFNPLEPVQAHSKPAEPVALPPGRRLLVRTPNRCWIPPGVIKKKFEVMLDRAIARQKVVHVFTHPHNFLTGKDQYEVLEGVLEAVAHRARGGEIRVMTQRSYCDWLYSDQTQAESLTATELVQA